MKPRAPCGGKTRNDPKLQGAPFRPVLPEVGPLTLKSSRVPGSLVSATFSLSGGWSGLLTLRAHQFAGAPLLRFFQGRESRARIPQSPVRDGTIPIAAFSEPSTSDVLT